MFISIASGHVIMLKHRNTLKSIGSAVLTVLFLGSSPPSLADSYSDKQGLIDELFEATGIEETVAKIPASFQSQFDAELSKLTASDTESEDLENIDALREISKDLLSAENILHSIRLNMLDSMSTVDLTEMIEWYRSDFGGKVLAAEKNGSAGGAQPAAQEELTAVSDSEINQREQLLQEIMKVSGTEDLLQMMIRGMGKSMMLGMSSTVDQEMRQGLQQGIAEMDRQFEGMQAVLNDHFMKIMHDLYRTLSIAELSRYGDDLSKPAFTAMNKSTIDAILENLNESGYTLGASLGEYFVKLSEQNG